MRERVPSLFVLLLIAVGAISISCGGGSTSENKNSNSTVGEAQGVYSGTTQGGYTFEAIILPDDKFYALHGTTSGNTFLVDGMMAGQGTSDHGSYNGTLTDYTLTPVSGTITATYIPGTSISGSITAIGVTLPFSATSMQGFNFNTAAKLSDIQGDWSATLLDGSSAFGTIAADGSLSGTAQGCTFTGKFTPNTTKNFFTVTLTFGGSPCLVPNTTASGAAVYYAVPGTSLHQLIAAGIAGNFGTAIIANR